MKNVGDLTNEEAQSLGRAQAELREAALIFASKPNQDTSSDLYWAARKFSDTCDSVGFKEYWKGDRWSPVIIPQA